MKKAVFMCVALLGLMCLAGQGRATDIPEWDAFQVHNRTGQSVTYQVRWGPGPWRQYTLAPGKILRHYHIADSSTPMPQPGMRFSRQAGGVVIEFTPQTRRSVDVREGYRYEFRATGGGVAVGR
jgi:hypothetical protein